jgi:hypothetical protein
MGRSVLAGVRTERAVAGCARGVAASSRAAATREELRTDYGSKRTGVVVGRVASSRGDPGPLCDTELDANPSTIFDRTASHGDVECVTANVRLAGRVARTAPSGTSVAPVRWMLRVSRA